MDSPAPAVTVSPPLPADDLDQGERETARLLTVYHRAGITLEQVAAVRHQALADLAALRDRVADLDPPLAVHLAQLLPVLPGTRYHHQPDGSWRCGVPGYGSADTRPAPPLAA